MSDYWRSVPLTTVGWPYCWSRERRNRRNQRSPSARGFLEVAYFRIKVIPLTAK
jgi:hypothetical protein